MDDRELAVECMKVAASVSSPTTHDRIDAIAEGMKKLYNAINSVDTVETDQPADTPRKPGRPRKPRAEQ